MSVHEFKPGDKVLVKKQNPAFDGSPTTKDIVEYKVVGNIYSKFDYNYGKIKAYYYVRYPSLSKACSTFPNNIAIPDEDLILATKEDIKETKKREKAVISKYTDAQIAFIKSLKQPKQGYLVRNYNHEEKQLLKTSANDLRLGAWNKATNEFKVQVSHRVATCCAMTKCLHDINIFIPKIWLDYYGYSELDFARWLKFLKECDINFQYHFAGLTTLPKELQYQGRPVINGYEVYLPSTSNGEKGYVHPEEKDYYSVIIGGSNDMKFHTYMRFICLRYMYNDQYWTIPGTAMQIKKVLGKKVSHWEALLMAHLRRDYNGYYALVAPNTAGQTVNVFQKPEISLANTRKGTTMNQSFEYIAMTPSQKLVIQKLFKEKEYLKIYNILKGKK